MHRESSPRQGSGHRTVSGARLATISVIAGAIATAASLTAVAYVAAIGSAAAPPEREGLRFASHSAAHRAARLPRDDDGAGVVRSVHETQIGGLVLVDIGADVVSLDDELDRQRAVALRSEQHLVLWLVVEDCKPCNAVEAALAAPDLQRALLRTRVVRLDAGEFLAELSRLGIPMDAFPSFVLLGPDGHAADYVDGSEWDDDWAPNIAPVLKSFVDGTYTKRRSPWHGGLHEDETPI